MWIVPHPGGATYILLPNNGPLLLHHFDFRTDQNSVSYILSSTGNPSDDSPAAFLQAGSLISAPASTGVHSEK